MDTRYVGTPVQRVEDPRLITGIGNYVDDIKLPDILHAAFVRSPFAHARVGRIDTEIASGMPGVVAVLTLGDLGEGLDKPIPEGGGPGVLQEPKLYAVANKAVHYVGETVAIVVARTRHEAEDAAALVDVDYDGLAAVADIRTALDEGAPLAHEDMESNLAARLNLKFGDADSVFASAPHVFTEHIEMHRGCSHSMECRGVLANPNGDEGRLDVWVSSQNPHGLQDSLAAYLGRDKDTIRVAAPDVGGGFGPKNNTYPEDFAVAAAALKLGQPVKWIEDRREHFLATAQQRDQVWDLDVAASSDGRLLGIRGRVKHDNGAYAIAMMTVPRSALITFPGPYALEALDVTVESIFTNMVPTSPVRGSSRPNVCFVLERLADRVARELKMDPAEVRRRSFVKPDEFPYETGGLAFDGKTKISYDSGDYAACLDMAIAPFADFRERQAKARKEGRYLGLGLASYVEDTGRAFEGARVTISADGKVKVTTGAGAQGQGLKTILTQIAADAVGVAMSDVEVETADTSKYHFGIGTIGSRTAVTAGSSVHVAAMEVREAVLKAAAAHLEAGNQPVEIENGVARIAGEPARSVSIAELAASNPELTANSEFNAGQQTYSNGTNVCEVEVDIETGAVQILRYVVGHDCGLMLNPGLLEGQIRGGVVHGIGNALFEHMMYDESGNPVTTNFGEYLLPIATEMPRIEIHHMETLSPRNPLGIKGAGEGGTIPAAACVISAVEDALAPFGVRLAAHPISPEDILEAIEAGQVKAA